MAERYDGPERRSVSRHEVADMVAEEIAEQLSTTETNLMNHINLKLGQFEASIVSVVGEALKNHVEEAFPPGPLHKHKDQHQKHIDSAGFWRKVIQDLQMWAIRGVLLFVFGLLMLGAKEWLFREMAK